MLRLARLMPTALDADCVDPASAPVTIAVRKRVPEHWRASTRRYRAQAGCPEWMEDRSLDEQINTDATQGRAAARHFVPGIFISTLSNGL
jgi:hypothetical protein